MILVILGSLMILFALIAMGVEMNRRHQREQHLSNLRVLNEYEQIRRRRPDQLSETQDECR